MNWQDFHDRADADEMIVLVGNGPSLRDMDLSALSRWPFMTCNRGHLLFDRIGRPSDYWAIEDHLDAKQFHAEFKAMRGPVKFVPEDLRGWDMGREDVLHVALAREPFDEMGVMPQFNDRPPFYWGGTVSYFMLQLAVFMGFGTIMLIGHDFNYQESHLQANGDIWTIGDTDVNHFDPSYWPEGSKAFAAKPGRMRLAFQQARIYCEQHAIRVVNATPGSRLDVFERVDFARMVGA